MFIPYGLDRLPRDRRLRCVEVGDHPLRLNSEPVPADAMPLVTGNHATRVAAAQDWLENQCGDYAPLRRQFIMAYFRFLAAQIDAHRDDLAKRLKPYDGLYIPEDFFWSAPRPLPRAWVPVSDRYLPADIAFWDGTRAIAIELSQHDSDKKRALLAAGIRVYWNDPNGLPEQFHRFWDAQTLPSSPFRRPAPSPPLGAERVG